MKPRIVIQLIHTTWTKASRGGEGARRRNALPLQLPLPLECFASSVNVHRVDFAECDDFQQGERVIRLDSVADLPLRDISLQLAQDSLNVKYIRNTFNRAIRRWLYHDKSGNVAYEPNILLIGTNEWGRFRYNARYDDVDTGNWWYEHSVFNIGLLTSVATDRFCATAPDYRYSEVARLR